MIRIVDRRLAEDCLDDLVIKEFEISDPLDEPLMRRLAEGGDLQYYPHFPRPYFRVRRARHYVIQGVIGNYTFRVTFLPADPVESERELVTLIENNNCVDPSMNGSGQPDEVGP